jgi:hypothetical protein
MRKNGRVQQEVIEPEVVNGEPQVVNDEPQGEAETTAIAQTDVMEQVYTLMDKSPSPHGRVGTEVAENLFRSLISVAVPS